MPPPPSSPPGPNQRFPPEHRIRRRAHYQSIQQRGHRVQSANFTWLLMPRDGHSRLGITASKRMGNAVQRNRIKRVLKEVFRRHIDIFPKHCDIVVIPRRSSQGLGYAEVLVEAQNTSARMHRKLVPTRQEPA